MTIKPVPFIHDVTDAQLSDMGFPVKVHSQWGHTLIEGSTHDEAVSAAHKAGKVRRETGVEFRARRAHENANPKPVEKRAPIDQDMVAYMQSIKTTPAEDRARKLR